LNKYTAKVKNDSNLTFLYKHGNKTLFKEFKFQSDPAVAAAEYYYLKASRAETGKKYSSALKEIKKALVFQPDNTRFNVLFVYIYMYLKKYTKAVHVWESVVKNNPKNFTYKLNFANSLFKLNRSSEAKKYYEELLDTKSDSKDILHGRFNKKIISKFNSMPFACKMTW